MEETQPKQQLIIQRVYLKQSYFEAPNTPHVFKQTQDWKPKVNLELQVNHTKLSDENSYEVTLKTTTRTTIEESLVHEVKVTQAGIFTISGFTEEQLQQILGSYCPNILFPYLRKNVSELVAEGGFPQLLLTPINFDALYAERQKKQAEEAKTEKINSEQAA